MRYRLATAAGFAMALGLASQALGAPFCVVVADRADCTYRDPNHCQVTAIDRRGDCRANPEPTRTRYTVWPEPSSYGTGNFSRNFPGHAPYCVVSPSSQTCYHYSEDACGIQAQREGGTCIVNPNRR